MELAYVAHRVRGMVDLNLALTKDFWMPFVFNHFPEYFPIAPWILTCEVLDDDNPEHRARGMEGNKLVVPLCKAVFLCTEHMMGPVMGSEQQFESEGMLDEAYLAREHGIPVYLLSE